MRRARSGAPPRVSIAGHAGAPLSALAGELSVLVGVDGFSLSHARN